MASEALRAESYNDFHHPHNLSPPPGAQYYFQSNGNAEGTDTDAAFLMHYPPPLPGVSFAYTQLPAGQVSYAYAFPMVSPTSTIRPKRKQVKMACTNCAAACKRCDEARPCPRCIKYGLSDSCVDGQRKERKKGTKRGPYKRKKKLAKDNPPSAESGWTDGDGANLEMSGPETPPSSIGSPVAAAANAVSQTAAAPYCGLPCSPTFATEGYYPCYYQPHAQYLPPQTLGDQGQATESQIVSYHPYPGGYPVAAFPHMAPSALGYAIPVSHGPHNISSASGRQENNSLGRSAGTKPDQFERPQIHLYNGDQLDRPHGIKCENAEEDSMDTIITA